MERWAIETETCERIESDSWGAESEYQNFILVTGRKELISSDEHVSDWDKNCHFSKSMSIKKLRIFLTKLPSMIEEIEANIISANSQNDTAITYLGSLLKA